MNVVDTILTTMVLPLLGAAVAFGIAWFKSKQKHYEETKKLNKELRLSNDNLVEVQRFNAAMKDERVLNGMIAEEIIAAEKQTLNGGQKKQYVMNYIKRCLGRELQVQETVSYGDTIDRIVRQYNEWVKHYKTTQVIDLRQPQDMNGNRRLDA